MSIFRYFFGILKWTKADLIGLDRTTRRIMRKNKCHQYCAASERLYLPRNRGGRGLYQLVHLRERKVVSTASYLVTFADPLLRAAVKHQVSLDKRGAYCVLKVANGVLAQYQLGMKYTEEGVFDLDGKAVSRRLLLRLLREAQYSELTVSLESKIIHGVFFKQCQEEGWDTSGSHAWLLDGRVQAQTETLIMAAPDGVILTRAYRNRVMGKGVSPVCRVCKGSAETIGHILSSCVPLQ